MIIQEEEYTREFVAECDEMIHDTLEEINVSSFEPMMNHSVYLQAAQDENLCLIVARDGEECVGYVGFWIMSDPQYMMRIVAQQAGIYLKPEYRKGLNAVRMLKYAEEILKEDYCVDVISLISTVKKDLSGLFKYLKYEEAETIYMKEI